MRASSVSGSNIQTHDSLLDCRHGKTWQGVENGTETLYQLSYGKLPCRLDSNQPPLAFKPK
jgi:hypothetical protein